MMAKTIPHTELMQRIGMSKSTFYRHLKSGNIQGKLGLEPHVYRIPRELAETRLAALSELGLPDSRRSRAGRGPTKIEKERRSRIK